MARLKAQYIIPVVKHIPGHGDTSLEKLKAIELVPFKKAIEAGVRGVMTAHILLPQIDADMLKEAILSGEIKE